MSSSLSSPVRHADFDWLRVMAILLLHFFHTGMMFNTWGWHIKAPELLPVLEGPMEFLHVLRMPLLMLVAGAGTALSLSKRTELGFAKDRVKRLLLPVVFGMLVVVPPQIYVERVVSGQFRGSYFDFFPSVFAFVPYPRGGSLSWHHLWFVVYLFVYCVVSLPLLSWFGRPRGRELLTRLETRLGRGAYVVLLAVPLALGRVLFWRHPETHALLDDPNTLLYYGQLFLFGHLLGRCPALVARLVSLRWKLLAAAIAIMIPMAGPDEFSPVVEAFGREAFVWTALLSILGFARARLTRRAPWLVYAQERAYPFYILHQTVIIVVGFCLLSLSVGPWSRFALVLSVSFVATWALCELVAGTRILRPFFGMAPRKPPRSSAEVDTPSLRTQARA